MSLRLILWVIVIVILVAMIISFGETQAATGSATQPAIPLQDNDAGSCAPQGVIVTQPIVDDRRFCPEYLVPEMPRTAIAAITSIAYAPSCDDTAAVWCDALFFVRPDAGTIMWVDAFDENTATYPLHTFADGLQTPTGLAWHDGAWYVSGEQQIYRLIDEDGDGLADDITTIVHDLPGGPGEWTGSIAIGPDNRIYVSKGASCGACVETDPRRAALLSYEPDGSGERIVAMGLHDAFDFAWHFVNDTLWIADSEYARIGMPAPLDEMNVLTSVGEDFGWPSCFETETGTVSDPLTATSQDCDRTTAPAFVFPAHSVPTGVVFYKGQAFPEYADDLLVVLHGSDGQPMPEGYNITRLCLDQEGNSEICLDGDGNPALDEQGRPVSQEIILPVDRTNHNSLDLMIIQGQSFYPDHPVDITVSPEGYIVISVMEGRIFRLMPRS